MAALPLLGGLAVAAAQEAVKIMALGDSITGSPVRYSLLPFIHFSCHPYDPPHIHTYEITQGGRNYRTVSL